MKKFSRIIAFAVLAVMVFMLSGCGEVSNAQKRVEGMLDTLKSGEYKQALEEYVCETEENKDFLGCEDDFSIENYPAYDAQMALFKSLKYKVLSSSTNGEGGIIFDVEITTLDLEPVGDRLVELSETFEYNYMEEQGEELSEEELQKAIDDAILREQIAVINEYLDSENKSERTSTVKIEVCHTDKKKPWMIHLNDEFINALAGGIYTKYGPNAQ